jgi:hypothetical protein
VTATAVAVPLAAALTGPASAPTPERWSPQSEVLLRELRDALLLPSM